jgi:hypothetical protein
MSRDWSAVEDAIWTWATTMSGVPAIWRHQNAPQPQRPYLVLHIDTISTETGSTPEDHGPDNNDYRTIYFTQDFMVSIMLFGTTDATSTLSTLLNTLWRTTNTEALFNADVIILDWDPVKDVSFTEQDHYVQKAIGYINCRTSYDDTYGGPTDTTAKTILEVNGDGTIKNTHDGVDILVPLSVTTQ